MLHTTRGIVLHTIPYSDSSVIVKIYTEQFGLQSYIVSGARSKKGKRRANLLQPLSQLDLVVMHREKNNLHRITELSCGEPYKTISEDIRKTSVALFLAEVLLKSMREEESRPDFYRFIANALHILDLDTGSCANYHFCFLMQLTRFLGFYPQPPETVRHGFFDLQEGVFRTDAPWHPYYAEPQQAELIARLMPVGFDQMDTLDYTNTQRRELLQMLLRYFELHLENMREIKSHKVLEVVFA